LLLLLLYYRQKLCSEDRLIPLLVEVKVNCGARREDEHNLIAQYCQCLHGCNSRQSVSVDRRIDQV